MRIISLVVLLAAAFQIERATAGGCYADWSVAAPIVRKEGLTTVEALARRAELVILGDIVKTTLCEEAGSYVYRLVIRDKAGHLSNRTVDARAPFGR